MGESVFGGAYNWLGGDAGWASNPNPLTDWMTGADFSGHSQGGGLANAATNSVPWTPAAAGTINGYAAGGAARDNLSLNGVPESIARMIRANQAAYEPQGIPHFVDQPGVNSFGGNRIPNAPVASGVGATGGGRLSSGSAPTNAFGTGDLQPRIAGITNTAGGGGAGVVPTISNDAYAAIYGRLQSLQDQANQANLDRYNQALATVGGGYDQAMGLADQFGTGQTQRVRTTFRNQRGAMAQDLTSRGLGNTTIAPVMQTGLLRNRDEQIAAINEQKAMMQAELARQKAAALGGIIENRTDAAPNWSLYAQLLANPGAANGYASYLNGAAVLPAKRKFTE